MANILDDLFGWAAQQPAYHTTQVSLAMTSIEITRNNLVSYADGFLKYHPGHSVGMIFIPASFASDANQITQYFSDRRFSLTPQGLVQYPFDPNQTDPLTISIRRSIIGGNYTIVIQSSKWNFSETFAPQFDAHTNVIYGSVGNGLVSIALCNRSSTQIK